MLVAIAGGHDFGACRVLKGDLARQKTDLCWGEKNNNQGRKERGTQEVFAGHDKELG